MTQLPLVHKELQEIVRGTRVQTSPFRGQLYYSPRRQPGVWVHRGVLQFTVDGPFLGGSCRDADGIQDLYPFGLASDFELAERHIRFFAKIPLFQDWMIGLITVGSKKRSYKQLTDWDKAATESVTPTRVDVCVQPCVPPYSRAM